jgi:hypothetical protein
MTALCEIHKVAGETLPPTRLRRDDMWPVLDPKMVTLAAPVEGPLCIGSIVLARGEE